MNINNKIGWCDATWSPVTGCTPVSEGCQNCWAKRMAETRLRGRCGYDKKDPFKVTFHPDRLNEPFKLKKPSFIFVCSMGDLFHEDVEFIWFHKIWKVMLYNRRQTFLLLTKRPEIMKNILGRNPCRIPVENIWLGVTVENQARADERIPILLSIPAAKRFVSVEPMLGPTDIRKWRKRLRPTGPSLDWVIAGPETGPNKRPCKDEWIDDLFRQCIDIPFWDKRKDYIERERPVIK